MGEASANPWGELLFWFAPSGQQFRLLGKVTMVTADTADPALQKVRKAGCRGGWVPSGHACICSPGGTCCTHACILTDTRLAASGGLMPEMTTGRSRVFLTSAACAPWLPAGPGGGVGGYAQLRPRPAAPHLAGASIHPTGG